MILYAMLMETVDPEKDAEVLDEHKAYLAKYLEEGKIYAKGPYTDHTGGLIIYNTETIDEARELIENDPVIKHKSRKYTLKEWRSTIEI